MVQTCRNWYQTNVEQCSWLLFVQEDVAPQRQQRFSSCIHCPAKDSLYTLRNIPLSQFSSITKVAYLDLRSYNSIRRNVWDDSWSRSSLQKACTNMHFAVKGTLEELLLSIQLVFFIFLQHTCNIRTKLRYVTIVSLMHQISTCIELQLETTIVVIAFYLCLHLSLPCLFWCVPSLDWRLCFTPEEGEIDDNVVDSEPHTRPSLLASSLQFAPGNGAFGGSQCLEGNRLEVRDRVGDCSKWPAKFITVQNSNRKKEENERKFLMNQRQDSLNHVDFHALAVSQWNSPFSQHLQCSCMLWLAFLFQWWYTIIYVLQSLSLCQHV